jgi:excisionase family DNA binding protein
VRNSRKSVTNRPEQESLCADGLLKIWPDSANFLNIGRATMFGIVSRGEIAYVRIGADRRIPRKALVAYAERRLVECKP